MANIFKNKIFGKIFKIIFLTSFFIFLVYYLKSGYHQVKIEKHNLFLARKCSDSFMLFVGKGDYDKAYNLFYYEERKMGKRDSFRKILEERISEYGKIKEIVFMSAYAQTNGPYLAMHYKVVYEKKVLDYFLLLLKEVSRYSVYQFIFGEAGTFYPNFSFKKKISKNKPIIIYEKK